MNLRESYDLQRGGADRLRRPCWCRTATQKQPENDARVSRRRETGLTRGAGSSPRWRRPISPKAIKTNTRHNPPLSTREEWPLGGPAALHPVPSCAAHNYWSWETCPIRPSALYSTIFLRHKDFAAVPPISDLRSEELAVSRVYRNHVRSTWRY